MKPCLVRFLNYVFLCFYELLTGILQHDLHTRLRVATATLRSLAAYAQKTLRNTLEEA